MSHPLFSELQQIHKDLKVYENRPLAPFTSIKIGGPSQMLAVATKQSELFDLLKFLTQYPDLPYTILGLGSNVVISDTGLPGLTIVNRATQLKIHPKVHPSKAGFNVSYTQRMENEPDKYLDFSKIDYDESSANTQEVTIQSGTPLPYAIAQTISQGLTGLQWFAYIPGTIGGAVYQNIHGGRYHLSDYIADVKVFNLKTGKTELYKKHELPWQYEVSFFQQNPHLVILSASLRLFKGDAILAKKVVDAWITQKTPIQPLNSSGSVFANPSLETCQKIWGEQKSAGWIIDHELNLKGHSIGNIQISDKHANFFVNNGNGTAADYYALMKLVQNKVREKFGFDLIPEVKFLGEF